MSPLWRHAHGVFRRATRDYWCWSSPRLAAQTWYEIFTSWLSHGELSSWALESISVAVHNTRPLQSREASYGVDQFYILLLPSLLLLLQPTHCRLDQDLPNHEQVLEDRRSLQQFPLYRWVVHVPNLCPRSSWASRPWMSVSNPWVQIHKHSQQCLREESEHLNLIHFEEPREVVQLVFLSEILNPMPEVMVLVVELVPTLH